MRDYICVSLQRIVMPPFDTSEECRQKLDNILINNSTYNTKHAGSLEYNAIQRAYCIERLLDGLKMGESEIEIFAHVDEREMSADILFKEIANCICFGLLANFTKEKNPTRELWEFNWSFRGYKLKVNTFYFNGPAKLQIFGLPERPNRNLGIFHIENLQDLDNDFTVFGTSKLFYEITSRKLSNINRGILHTPVEFCLFINSIHSKKYSQPASREYNVPGYPVPSALSEGNYSRQIDDMKNLEISNFFNSFAHLICKHMQKNPATGQSKLVSKVENFSQTRQFVSQGKFDKHYDIQINWRFNSYSFNVYRKEIGYGVSLWYLRIENDKDSLLDSMFSCTHSLNTRLSRLEALIASQPQLE